MEHQVTINGKEYTLTLDLGKFSRSPKRPRDTDQTLYRWVKDLYGTLELFAQLADVSVNSIVTDPEFKLVHLRLRVCNFRGTGPFSRDKVYSQRSSTLPRRTKYYKMAEQVVTAELVKKLSL